MLYLTKIKVNLKGCIVLSFMNRGMWENFFSEKGVNSGRSMVCCIPKLKFQHRLNSHVKISLCQ